MAAAIATAALHEADRPKPAASVSIRLRDEIEGLIATGGFAPGERLDEVQLATRFNVSRTPIRQALHELAASGLVDIQPRRGATVARMGPQRMIEMFELMAELEAMCARLAVRRMSAADGASIRLAHEACEMAARADETDVYYAANEQFHQALYRASHNAVLEEECRRIAARLRPYRRLQLRLKNRVGQSFAEHGAIVEALLAGDSEAASLAARAHVAVQGERFADLMALMRAAD
jgi:DNA-binding GntR family transcriptional regulator